MYNLSPVGPVVPEKKIFEGIFSYFSAFWLPWQPIMIRSGIKAYGY